MCTSEAVMELDEYVVKQNKKLRCGYTTGSCAAAASKAAAEMLLGGTRVSDVELMTPKGILLHLDIFDVSMDEVQVSCAVKKDGGDDPDATNGIFVYAHVRYGSRECFGMAEGGEEDRISIDGGEGVGRVTLPGLEQPVGAAAINSVPRRMIREAVLEICEQYDYAGGLDVVISVPGGADIAAKTFNPRLGIEGGISILGTTGIVEPMSEDALIKSIEVEMKVQLANGDGHLVVIPGNYGRVFADNELGIDTERTMKCSNYVGETIDFAVSLGAKSLLLIGHIGKFIKLSGGIMNTHSRNADSRMELMAAAAVRAGAPYETVKGVLAAGTTDEALRIIKEAGYLDAAMENIIGKTEFYTGHRAQGAIPVEVVMFSNVYGLLGKTKGADELLALARG